MSSDMLPVSSVAVHKSDSETAPATVLRRRQGSARDVDAKTKSLLTGPILPTLLRLAWPNFLVSVAQSSTGLIEMWYLGKLGPVALAGVALVTPILIFMQNISQGALGGGISSSIARALGANSRDHANKSLVHAVFVAVLLGACFTLTGMIFGGALYRILGGSGAGLQAAETYSLVVFAGMIPLWSLNALASALRGAGNMLVPSIVICTGTIFLIPVSYCFIFGAGPMPALGIAGGGLALTAYYVGGTLTLFGYIVRDKSIIRFCRTRIRWHPIKEIVSVGVFGLLNTTAITVGIATTMALVARHAGPGAVAGFGTGSRLEYFLPALVFGVGAPLVTMVGVNIGAGQSARALRIALTGAGLAAIVTEAIGLACALWPRQWLELFGSTPDMLEIGSLYLRIVGPSYGFFGMGLSLYFACQGARRLAWPLIATVVRMCLTVGCGWFVLQFSGSVAALLLVYSLAMALYGLVVVGSVVIGSWGRVSEPAR